MNCYEWRKQINCTISVQVELNLSFPNYTETGSHTFEHDAIYTAWTHRELQCEGGPLSYQPAWVLRGDNLCEGRAVLVGLLTQKDTMTVTQVIDGVTSTYQAGLYFQRRTIGELWETTTSLLPQSPYPDWELDPFSTAGKNVIDSFLGKNLYAGIYDVAFEPPPSSEGFPSAPVGFKWLKDGESGENTEYGLQMSLSVQVLLP